MRDKIVFVITTWFFSRSVVILGMQFIAPMLHISPLVGHPLPLDYVSGFVARSGWELFTHWDGAWYRKVAVFGYDYADDGQKHSIAFFPLFPLICRGFMSFGLPFDVAGPLTNNLSFLGALFLLYNWAEERYGVQVARWATSVLAWCPFSLFGTVAYTEGLFLFCTVGTLRSFDNCQYFRAAVWGALATADSLDRSSPHTRFSYCSIGGNKDHLSLMLLPLLQVEGYCCLSFTVLFSLPIL